MSTESSFVLLMERLRNGDQEAASQVFGRFLHRLMALIQLKFDHRLRSRDDPEDLIQSVYLSFIKKIDRSASQLTDWAGFWSLLATITVRKCHDRRRYWRAGRRDFRREAGSHLDADGQVWWEAVDRNPTPLQSIVLEETWEKLNSGHNPQQRTIAEMTLQGYSKVEIAEHCGCAERTVYRVIKRMQDRLLAMDTETEADTDDREASDFAESLTAS